MPIYVRKRVVPVREYDGHGDTYFKTTREEFIGYFSHENDMKSNQRSYQVPESTVVGASLPHDKELFVVFNHSHRPYGEPAGVYATLEEATAANPEWRPFREGMLELLCGRINTKKWDRHRFLPEHIAHLEELKVQERQRAFLAKTTAT